MFHFFSTKMWIITTDVYNKSLKIVFFFASKELKPAVRSSYVISQVALTSSTLMERAGRNLSKSTVT